MALAPELAPGNEVAARSWLSTPLNDTKKLLEAISATSCLAPRAPRLKSWAAGAECKPQPAEDCCLFSSRVNWALVSEL